jgi:hypothetical protein
LGILRPSEEALVSEERPADEALAARMKNPTFARAYDVWLVVMIERAGEIELDRTDRRHRPLPPQGPRGQRARKTVPDTA